MEAIKNARALEAVRLINENPNIAITKDAIQACEKFLNLFYKEFFDDKYKAPKSFYRIALIRIRETLESDIAAAKSCKYL
ncbi:hypothetical protein [Campylobacter taeniopygiae]|uniref:hypothetical protein n=1 Tax=Campylobacter taeniopygiae TaxID=2510188 RepID=UPI001484FC49|nr:hypothetical protein [Campylobacter taeniopygiae]